MNLIKLRAMLVVALSIMAFTATAAVLSGLQNGVKAFSGDPSLVIYSRDAPTIFSSQVDNEMVAALDAVGIRNSPEIFAFCSYGGESFVVRGVNFTRYSLGWQKYGVLSVPENLSRYDSGSALIGSALKERLGIDLPFTMPLVGSYTNKMDFVTVLESFKTGTTLDDELLVNLERARFLSGMALDKVSIIRISSSSAESVRELLAPQDARFTAYDLHSSKNSVAPGESFAIDVSVRNWGKRAGEVAVTFWRSETEPDADPGTLIENVTVSVNASSTVVVARQFSINELGEHYISVKAGEDVQLPLFVKIKVVSPYIQYWGPREVMLGEPFNATVLRYDSIPVANATVTFNGESYLTDAGGKVVLIPEVLGNHTLHAEAGDLGGFNVSIGVRDPASFPNEFYPMVLGLVLSAESIKESESVNGLVQLTNGGLTGGTYELAIYVDFLPGQLFLYNVPLGPLETKQFAFTLDDLAVGTHSVHVDMYSREVVVEPWFVDDWDYVELVVRYGGNVQVSDPGSIPIYQAAKISQANVELALLSIGAIAGLLAVLAISAVFSKEIHESRRRLGILKTMGAGRRHVASLVTPRAVGIGVGGAVAGLLAGLFVAERLSTMGVFMLLGHRLRIDWNEQILVVIFVAAVAISVVSALVSTVEAMRESAIGSIKGVDAEQPRHKLALEDIADD